MASNHVECLVCNLLSYMGMSSELVNRQSSCSHSPRNYREHYLSWHNVHLSGTVGESTLTVEQIPSHEHDIKYRQYVGDGTSKHAARSDGSPTSGLCLATGGSQSHTHNYTDTTSSSTNLPPYYALYYIMRIA